MTEPTVMATEYTVNAIPEDIDELNRSSFEIKVCYRGKGLWAVTRGKLCLGTDGQWDWEPLLSDRTKRWMAEHRFDIGAALALAKREAPMVTVNGWTVQRAIEAFAAHRAGGQA